MSEKATLEYLTKSLSLKDWYKDFTGDKTTFDDVDIDKIIERIPHTDATASMEIARKMDHQLSYVAFTDTWYAWNGIIHVPCDGSGIILKIVKLLWAAMTKAIQVIKADFESKADAIRSNQSNPNAADEAKALMKSYEVRFFEHKGYRDRLASEAGKGALSREARIELDVDADYFEDDTQWFVMRNWVLDLEALKEGNWVLLPHSPKRNVTRYFDADYPDDPKAANLGHWDGYLKRSIPDETQRNYLQTAIGAGYTGIGKLRALLVLVGPPGTGKSLILDALGELGSTGAHYAKKVQGGSIMQANGQNFAQDEYRGLRLAYVSEPPDSGRADGPFLKAITGDGNVSTRTLNKRESAWSPQCLLVIAANQSLKIDIRDPAIVERVQEIQFPVRFYPPNTPGVPADQIQIRGLEDLLLRDRSRILMWIIAGMRRFINDGMVLQPPDSVVQARDKVVVAGSTALQWLEEAKDEGIVAINYDVPKSHFLTVNEAYQHYTMWAQAAGERKPLTRKYFSKDIQAKYGEAVPSGGMRLVGLMKTEEWERKYNPAWLGS
jgi:phage/plasmid-associated DNA primase